MTLDGNLVPTPATRRVGLAVSGSCPRRLAATLPRMELVALSARALQVHAAFVTAAARNGQRPWTREEVMQGFVGDVGDLMKLSMAKAGARPIADVDRKLAHELSDCLWSVLVLAKLYDVDLEKEFERTMAEIETKLA